MKVLNPLTTLKVVVSYAAIVLLIGVFFFIFFEQIKILNGRNVATYDNTNTSFLLSNTLNDLLELEPLKRQYLDLPTAKNFNKLKEKYTTISDKTKRLRQEDFSKEFQQDFDKIESLLSSKLKNLIALKNLYQRQSTSNYLGKAVQQLQQLDTLPKDTIEVKKSQRNRLFRRIKANEEEKLAQKVAQIDSVVDDVSSKLKRLAINEKKIKQRITAKEDELLQKDITLNGKIRGILYQLEQQAFLRYSEQLAQSKIQLKEAIWTVGISSLFTLFAGAIFFLLIRRDLIRSTKNERVLIDTNKKIKEALNSKENLIQMVSHDVRSPLQVILGNIEILDNSSLNQESKTAFDEMRYASTYILNLVTDLLYFFKGKSIQISYSNFNPYQLISNVVNQNIPLKNKKNLQIYSDIDTSLDATFNSDPHRLQQIVTNILSNAYKFTIKGSIHVRVLIEDIFDQEHLSVEVIDTGVGISKDKKQFIFERFQRGDFENTHKDGFGLGLFITKFLVDELKGNLIIESEEGKGTHVQISIPLLQANQKPLYASTNQQKDQVLANKLIYIVDDDVAYLRFVETILTKMNMQSRTFSSAHDTLLRLKKESPDIIITDLNMPEIDGIAFLQKIQKKSKHDNIPVIAFTGELSLEDSYFVDLGFAAKIAKPATASTIKEILFEVLDRNIQAEKNKHPLLLKIPAIYDVTKSLEMFDGDTKALGELLQVFVERTEVALSQLTTEIIHKNTKKIQQITHKILPLFKQFEMQNCVENLNKLEATDSTYTNEEAQRILKELRNDLLKIKELSINLLKT